MGLPPTGGSHGNPNPTARVHHAAGRRDGDVAARGPGAAGADAGHRVSAGHEQTSSRSSFSRFGARAAVMKVAPVEEKWGHWRCDAPPGAVAADVASQEKPRHARPLAAGLDTRLPQRGSAQGGRDTLSAEISVS